VLQIRIWSDREVGDPLTARDDNPQNQDESDYETIVASSRREPWRLSHLMGLVVVAAVVIWMLLLFPGFAILTIIVIAAAAIMATGFLRGKRRAARQDALLAVMAIAAEKEMPLAPAVAAYASQYGRGTQRPMLRLAHMLNSGVSLSESLMTAPGLLSQDAVLLARVGEQAGGLPKALRAGATARASSLPILTAIASRITYVLALLTAMQAIMGFLLYFILPKLESIFKDFGISLPTPTLLVIQATHTLMAGSPIVLLLILAQIVLMILLPFKIMSWWNFQITLLDRLFRRRHTALILRALSLVVGEGRPIALGLECLARNYPTRWVRHRLIEVEEDVRRGEDWCMSLWRHGLIRSADGALLSSAQTTGNLAWAMRELADTSDRRSFIHFQAIVQMLFPLVILALGFMVLLVAVAYFLPLIRLIERLG